MSFTPRIREKVWNPSVEAEIFRQWDEDEVYRLDLSSGKTLFTIDTPPPYPSGRPWHIGAAAHYSQIDMIARAARMMGYEVYFPIGIDRNGLPVELYTERKYGVKLHKVGREEFTKLCRNALDDLEAEMIEIMKTMGLSADFKRYYRTDSEDYRAFTQATFIELWRKGVIYEATRPNNYCPECRTTIADAEVVYEELPIRLIYMRFKLVEKPGEDVVIATTRPELLCSCQIVLVHPDDERYKHLHGMHVQVPLHGRSVEIRSHPSVKPGFGSGAVMVCSYGDYTDVLLFRELGLKEIIAIGEDGMMTDAAGPFVGLAIEKAQSRAVEELKERGLLVKVEDISHRTPVCERSGTPIEIIPMKEYYLKQMEYKSILRDIARKMRFHPEAHRQILIDWIDSIRIDWPISRRRYYATEIPVWYCKKCGEPHLPEPGRYHRPWIEPPPFEKCLRCGGKELVGDTRTFDTWVDSSVSPLYITRYLRDDEFFRRSYPTALRPQAKDIIRTWLHYTNLRCYQLTGRPPFTHAWIMGYGVDEKGERMSKSKGNVIDPSPILRKYGADTFRFWSASVASLGSDFRCSEKRIAGAKNFLTKLWNISRFISSFPHLTEADPTPTDRWILGELSRLIQESLIGYEDFNFFIPAVAIRETTWSLFAAHYIEMAKARAYGDGFLKTEQEAAWQTLHTCLKTILLLLAPITPFITESIWRRLYSQESIHRQSFPKPEWSRELTKLTPKLIEFNSIVWNMKKAKGMSLKEPILTEIPLELRIFEKDLKAMHNIT